MSDLSAELLPLLRSLVRKIMSESFERNEASVVTNMEIRGMTPDQKPLRDCIRDAIFRLIRRVVPSGTVSDAIRDALDTEVVKRVMKRLSVAEKDPDLTTLVGMTREELIAVLKEAVD